MAVTDLHSLDIATPLDKMFQSGVKIPGAILSLVQETPQINIGQNVPLVLNGRAKGSLVHEGGKKKDNGRKVEPRPFTTAKLVYSQRTTDEFMSWQEQAQADFVSRLVANWINKSVPRDIDSVVIHGFDPLTSTVDSQLSDYITKTGSSILVPSTGNTAAQIDTDFATAVRELKEYDINGVAVSTDTATKLATILEGNNKKYPELGLFGLSGSLLGGKPAATSPEVDQDGKTKLILGDFSQLLLGFAGTGAWKVLTAGDPDNTGRDLAGHNEVMVRFELHFGFRVLDPKAIAVVKAN